MYEQPVATDLSQGDILDDCPILVWKLAPPPLDLDVPPEILPSATPAYRGMAAP
jgi:hypothetical protein